MAAAQPGISTKQLNVFNNMSSQQRVTSAFLSVLCHINDEKSSQEHKST